MPSSWDNIARIISAQARKQVAEFNQQTNTVPGPTGSTGAQGPKGEKGDPGDPGKDGTLGPQGPMGVQGTAGERGEAGPEGPVGVQGSRGPQGVEGPPGPQGPQGIEGPKGDDGPVGPAGPKGDPGMQGPQGAQGTKGDTGAVGATGAKGDTGVQGVKGATGATGPEAPYWSDAVMTGNDGFVTVTFPAGMFTEPPQVEVTAVNPTSTANPNGENRAYNAEVIGDPTTTQARIRVRAYPMGSVTVLLGAVTVNEAPGKPVKVLVTATKRRIT